MHGSVLLNLAAHGAAQAGKAPLDEGLNAGMQNFAHLAVDTVIAVGGHCSDLVAGVYILHVHTLQGHPKLIRHLQTRGLQHDHISAMMRKEGHESHKYNGIRYSDPFY